jgi:S-adenosylmethionine decarboxylase
LTVHFEGAEKALEVVVHPDVPPLRTLGDAYFRALVALADGSVLRRTVTPEVDAYLLAESTLFVSDRHLLMLTCGRTRVYRAAERLVTDLGAKAIAALSLTRFGERFPDEQHSTIEEDARVLGEHIDGRFVQVGARGPHRGGAFVHDDPPRTRVAGETRMRFVANDIDADVAACFTSEKRAAQSDALSRLLAHLGTAHQDDFDFEPSGFSLNAVAQGSTFALHVTPEHASSYVSLVSSYVDAATNEALVHEALETFRPKTCLVTTEAKLVLPASYRVVHEGALVLGGVATRVIEAERYDLI